MVDGGRVGGNRSAQRDDASSLDLLDQRVTTLELELSKAKAVRAALREGNEELRDQLEWLRGNLESGIRGPVRKLVHKSEQIEHRDIALLQQMLVEREAGERRYDPENGGST